jgi:hypothetical protein
MAAIIPLIRCLAEPPYGCFKLPTAIEAWASRDQLIRNPRVELSAKPQLAEFAGANWMCSRTRTPFTCLALTVGFGLERSKIPYISNGS